MDIKRVDVTAEASRTELPVQGRQLTILYVPPGARLRLWINDDAESFPVFTGFAFAPIGGVKRVAYEVTTAADTAQKALIAVGEGSVNLDPTAHLLQAAGLGGAAVIRDNDSVAALGSGSLDGGTAPVIVESFEISTDNDAAEFTIQKRTADGSNVQAIYQLPADGTAAVAPISAAGIRTHGHALFELLVDAAGTYKIALKPAYAGRLKFLHGFRVAVSPTGSATECSLLAHLSRMDMELG